MSVYGRRKSVSKLCIKIETVTNITSLTAVKVAFVVVSADGWERSCMQKKM